MALLGHVSAEMSLRYGRLFDATVRAEYERALTLAKQRLGPVPARRATAAALSRDGDWREAPADQGPPRRWLLRAHPRPGRLPLRQHLRALPELPHRHRPSCPSSPPNAPTPQALAADAEARGWSDRSRPAPPAHRTPRRPHPAARAAGHDRTTAANRVEQACRRPPRPGNRSPSTTSPPAPASAGPPSTATPSCAPSSRSTANSREALTLTGLTAEIDHLRTALEAVAANVRRHEEQLRRIRSR